MNSTLIQEIKEYSEISNTKPSHNLHQIAPYMGKIRPDLGKYLTNNYCTEGGTLWDPFMGSGTILLEGWILGQKVVGTDLNDYAYTLTNAKLFPPHNIEIALNKIHRYNDQVQRLRKSSVSNCNDLWVRSFFHPETLLEIELWSDILKRNKEWFLMACLLGVLHHQRPGSLSFPCSNGAPYLRDKKYPRDQFPEMYEYRDVLSRLTKKVEKVLRNIPALDHSIERIALLQNSYEKLNISSVDTIITSPPYMKALTYARDNRLRLWFLGKNNWKDLDKEVSPGKQQFVELMKRSFQTWSKYQKLGDLCIVIIGDIMFNKNAKLSDILIQIARDNKYTLSNLLIDPIPEAKKIVKGNTRIKHENVCVFKKD
jgi:DNA modification methylase